VAEYIQQVIGDFMETWMFFVVVIGSVSFGLGIVARLGRLKRTFITKGIPIIHPKTLVYALIPTGLFFLLMPLWGSEDLLGRTSSFILFLVLQLLIVTTLIWQPYWLKPSWLQWMENNYGHVLDDMFEEARQMGGYNWEAHVKTQDGLEKWADSVAKEHGWHRLR